MIGGSVTRIGARTLVFYDWPAVAALDRASLQAGLATAYGTARGFWRVYQTWSPESDASYLAELAAAVTPLTTRHEAKVILERFSASLHDAHIYVADLAADATSHEFVGVIPVSFDVLDGAPVVRSSPITALHAGDTVVEIDHTPVAQWLEPYSARIASATPLNHAVVTASRLGYFTSPTRDFTLRAPGGAMRTVTVATGSSQPPFGPQRASGWLSDLGASDVYYVNINGAGGPMYTSTQLLAQLDTARSGHGLVIDGRGYPSAEISELIARIVGGPAPSPQFEIPLWAGRFATSFADESYTQPGPNGPAYTKPVAVLVGPSSQSSAENYVMLMLQRPDLSVVGRQTSGSNGNITSVMLPGGFGMAFTGMRVTYADGSPFHGVGIHLTRESHPTVADYAAGIDREILDGIAVIHGAQSH